MKNEQNTYGFLGVEIFFSQVGFCIKKCSTFAAQICNGALAQLARAFDWQSRGHRFDSVMLHETIKPADFQRVFVFDKNLFITFR